MRECLNLVDEPPATDVEARMLARERGFKTYATGRPCKHGHVSPRYASSGGCVSCLTGRYAKVHLTKHQKTVWGGASFPYAVPLDFSDDERDRLNAYLRRCLLSFMETVRPESDILGKYRRDVAMAEATRGQTS